MKEKAVSRISNKLTKTRVLVKHPELNTHIPATRRMDKSSLLGMLEKYGMVYIKPCCGSLGKGVIRVERLSSGGEAGRSDEEGKQGASEQMERYRYQAGTRVSSFAGYDKLYRALAGETLGKPYLVQKGIRLLTYESRPFDIRVMVQKSPKGQWEATGIAGRVAHPRKVVTNGSQGGTIYPVETLLETYTSMTKRTALIDSMNRLGVKAAVQLSGTYPGLREIGVDIALDKGLHPWILEVNTYPDPCPFTKLPDDRMLRRIVRYGKAYGRIYCLKCTKAKRGVG
jgi:glutathione synthase/RimK-type ligase-like ATP-grasp enzyme